MPHFRRACRLTVVASATLLSLGAGATSLEAQRLPVGDSWEEYLRVLQAAGLAGGGSFTVRPFALGTALGALGSDAQHPWSARVTPPTRWDLGGNVSVTAADPGVRLFANSAFADGQNDGAVWQGKGLSAAMDAGATLRVGPLTLTAHPTFLYSQNGEFDLAEVSRAGASVYAYPWRTIDLPQRFGPDAVTRVDPGNSSARLDLGALSLGFGTESLWWGPGVRNAILMSNNAGGFPHGFLGTGRPVETGIGSFEAQYVFGRLQMSEWFDSAFVDPGRFVTGAVGSYSPSFLDGLTLGMARVFYAFIPEDGLSLGDYFLVFQTPSKGKLATEDNPTGDDERDQLFSMFARWVLPESGFEAWLEWSRNDHGSRLLDYFLSPEHSQGYTLGFRKVVPMSGERLFALTGELTHLEHIPKGGFANPPYYAHHLVLPGYTQRGQVIGSGLGPGGNAQYIAGDVFAPWGKFGAFLQRRVHDADAWYDGSRECCGPNVSLDVGAGGLFWVNDVEVGVQGMITREYNRHFIDWTPTNANLQLSARWRPR